MAKLYVRIAKICFWIFCVCVLFSIFLAVLSNNSPICTLLENYAIGIACSSLLVIIPIILQYLSEMERINKDKESSIFSIILNLYIGLDDELNINQYKFIWSQLDKDFSTINICIKESAYFTRRHARQHFEELNDILQEYIKFEKTRCADDKSIIEYISNYDRFIRLANLAHLIIKSDWEKDHIQKLIEMAEKRTKKHINATDQTEVTAP